jgi:hypothetical protein
MGESGPLQPPVGFLVLLHGPTLADNDRHWIVRREFMRLLLASAQGRALLREWETNTGLGAITNEIRAAQLALEATLASQLRGGQVDPERDPIPPPPPALEARFQDAMARFAEASAAFHRYIWDGVDAFVVNLPGGEYLPWPWLRQDLVRAFELHLQARLEDRRPQAGELYQSIYVPPLATPEAFTFTPAPDESAADAAARVGAEVAAYQARLVRAIVPEGRGADQDDKEALKRYAAWVCDAAVLGTSIRRIAIQAFGDEEGRSHVRRGIARARALLALAGELTPVYADAAADGLAG